MDKDLKKIQKRYKKDTKKIQKDTKKIQKRYKKDTKKIQKDTKNMFRFFFFWIEKANKSISLSKNELIFSAELETKSKDTNVKNWRKSKSNY